MENDRYELYTTRSLRELKDQLTIPMTVNEQAILLVKIASNLARLTRTKEARAVIKDIRTVNKAFEPLLTSWIMFCEGLIYHFEAMQDYQAFDRFRRAYIFASALKERELASSCAAWIAKCEFVAGKYASMHAHLVAAFSWADECHGDARARASVVIADALNTSGQIDDARKWYRIARNYAVAEGDISMQNVILFNTAAFAVGNLVLQDCFGEVVEKERWRAMMELNSATNLDLALGSQQLQTLTPILRAELSTVEKKWDEAISIFEQNIENSTREGHLRQQPKHLANCAWCYAGLNKTANAWRLAENAINCLGQCNDPDDLAVIHFRVSRIALLCGMNELGDKHSKLALEKLDVFRAQQQALSIDLKSTLAEIEGIDAKKKNPT